MQYTFEYNNGYTWIAPMGLDSCEAALAFKKATGVPAYMATMTLGLEL